MAYGPAHSEIKLTAQGPTLIESGARLAGKGIPRFAKHCVGLSQVELTADAYLDFESFDAKTKSPYLLRRNALWVDLICRQPEIVQSIVGLERIKQLESFHALHVHVEEGDRLEKPRISRRHLVGSS
ncbi:MAG TPA: hypothetical protein VIS99_07185 [Terrimicrobiaceae bacterium]